MKFFSHLTVATLVLSCWHIASNAQTYPLKPITLVIPLAAGSTNDVLARTIQPELSKLLGQPIVVENRPGAGGLIGMRAVTRSNPDGYTLILSASNTWAINVGLYKDLSYDPIKDFTPVAYLATASNTLVVNGKTSWNNVKELVEGLREKPGHYNFSSGGNGTSQHLGGELLKVLTNTHAVHIPFGGAPQGVVAIVSGQVDFGFFNTPSVLPFVRDGRLKALAVTSKERSSLLPQTPTMVEAGFKNYVMGVAMGVLAPTGTPPAIVAKLNTTLNQLIANPELKNRLLSLGYDSLQTLSPEQLGQFIQRDIAFWVPLVKQSGAQID